MKSLLCHYDLSLPRGTIKFFEKNKRIINDCELIRRRSWYSNPRCKARFYWSTGPAVSSPSEPPFPMSDISAPSSWANPINA